MEVFLEILYRFGLPTALLLLLAWERFHTVRKKDAQITAMQIGQTKALAELAREKDQEIKRLNEARISDAAASTDRSIKVATEFTELVGESNKTNGLMVQQLSALTTAVDKLRDK